MDLRALTAVSLTAALGVACSSSPTPEVSKATGAIVDGTIAAGDDAVGALVAWDSPCESAPLSYCTVVLVSPRVVLTAAHCLDDLRGRSGAVFFGSEIGGEGTYVPIESMEAHLDFDQDTRDFDVAVLVLAEAAPATPVELSAASIGDVPIGSELRAVGFGITSSSDLEHATAGVRREGTMALQSVSAIDFVAAPAPAMTCRIDSGGPVFADVGGVEILVGITSGGDEACVETARNTRLDAVMAFVSDRIGSVPAESPRPAADEAVLGALCDVECRADEDCPLSMSCDASPAGAYCSLLTLDPGSLETVCGSWRDCGGNECVRVLAAGPEACRCHMPCSGTDPWALPDSGTTSSMDGGAGSDTPDEGCAVADGRRAPLPALGWLLLLAASLRRRRRPGRGR